MACECGEKYLRVWPAKCDFSVSLGKDPVAPLRWNDKSLHFCRFCGDIKASIPPDVLQVIQEADDLME